MECDLIDPHETKNNFKHTLIYLLVLNRKMLTISLNRITCAIPIQSYLGLCRQLNLPCAICEVRPVFQSNGYRYNLEMNSYAQLQNSIKQECYKFIIKGNII